MQRPEELDSRPYLSIVSWPEGWSRDHVVHLLAQYPGLDPPTLRLRLSHAPPMVLPPVEPAVAGAAVAALREAGGDAFAFTIADLAATGPALRIADLAVVEGAVAVELEQGLSTRLRFADVDVIVRAHLRRQTVTRREPPRFSSTFRPTRTWDSIWAEIESSTRRGVATSDKLDLHTADNCVYRVDGDRFGFRVLGELRGHSDKASMDRLLELLRHLCPDAVADTYFRLFRPPPAHHRLVADRRLATAGEEPDFAFYSRWAAMTWRHAMGR